MFCFFYVSKKNKFTSIGFYMLSTRIYTSEEPNEIIWTKLSWCHQSLPWFPSIIKLLLYNLLLGSLAFHSSPKHASWIHFVFSFCSLSVLGVLELSTLLIQDSGSRSQPTFLLQILRSMCCSLKQTLAICTSYPPFVSSLSLFVGNCVCQGQCVRWTFSNSFLYSFGHDLIKCLYCVM